MSQLAKLQANKWYFYRHHYYISGTWGWGIVHTEKRIDRGWKRLELYLSGSNIVSDDSWVILDKGQGTLDDACIYDSIELSETKAKMLTVVLSIHRNK